MGHSNSCLPLCYRNKPSRDLTYNLPEILNKNPNAIDINKVSEDELLFLPGINRQLAINIIQYRHNNDGFKQVNELLKVQGITYDLFKHIHNDLTINKKNILLNLNHATYDELCLIPGLTSKLVQRILKRRKKKGSFHFIEDLLQIKGIDYMIFEIIRPYLTIDNTCLNNLFPLFNQNTAIDTLSLASLLLETLPTELQTVLISSSSSSPHSPLTIETNLKENIFRFASWNLQQLTNDKVQNPGVREVICRVILENNLSLIGIQEIGNKESLDFIINELNNPIIPSIKDWSNRHQGKWKYIISDIAGHMLQTPEYFGFIYDESIGIELKQASLFTSKSYFTRSPFIARFCLYKKIEFIFVNIHLKSRTSNDDQIKIEAKALAILAQAIKNTFEQKNVIIFGSFNIIPTALEFDGLIKCNYSYMIEQNTDINLKNLQGSSCLDNIWLSKEANILTTEKHGVIRDKLTSLWIPADWTWGGLVSDHCPIWIEFDLS